jgi:iron complex transport system substrate-binding protein
VLTRRRFLGAALAMLAAPGSAAAQRRAVVDGAGRRVEVPASVRRVFAAGGPASIFLYTLAPDTLLGWTRQPTPEERSWLPARYADLPALGRLTGRGNTANVEVVLAARPDVVLDVGSVGPTYVSLADRVQEQIKVPYILLDGSLSATSARWPTSIGGCRRCRRSGARASTTRAGQKVSRRPRRDRSTRRAWTASAPATWPPAAAGD